MDPVAHKGIKSTPDPLQGAKIVKNIFFDSGRQLWIYDVILKIVRLCFKCQVNIII